MRYLENKICHFKPLFKVDKKKNIVVVVLFQPEKQYNGLKFYVKGVQNLGVKVKNDLPGFKLRVFIDNRIYKIKGIMDTLKAIDIIEIVVFSCPNFLTKDNYHVGLFGTFLRFFPLFNFPNNDAKDIIVLDADYHPGHYNGQDRYMDYTIRFYKKICNYPEARKLQLCYTSDSLLRGHNYNDDILRFKNYLTPYISAGGIFSFQRMNKNLLLNFMSQIDPKNRSYSLYEGKYKDERSGDNAFVYGVDEYFLNRVIVDHMMENKIPLGFSYPINFFTMMRRTYLDYPDTMNIIFEKVKFEGDRKAFYKKNFSYDTIFNPISDEDLKILEKIYKYVYKCYLKGEYLNNDKRYLDIVFHPKLLGWLYLEKYKVHFGEGDEIMYGIKF